MGNWFQAHVSPALKVLENANISTDVITNIRECLANNDLKAFETLARDIMSNNDLSLAQKLEIHNEFKNNMENSFNGNKAFEAVNLFSGDTLTSASSVFLLTVIVLAMIFKDGVPFSLLVLFVLVAFMVVLAVKFVKDQMQAQKKEQDRLFGKGGVLLKSMKHEQPRVALNSLSSSEVTNLLSKADCRCVDRKVVDCANQVQSISALYIVAEFCSNQARALKGKLDRGFSFAGPGTTGAMIEQTNQQVGDTLTKMFQSVDEIHKTINHRSDAIANTARFSNEWEKSVEFLKKKLERNQKKLPTRPDFLLTEKETEKKDTIILSIQQDVANVIKEFKEHEDRCMCEDDLDYEAIKKRCQEMIQVLAYTPQLEQQERQSIQKAIQTRDTATEAAAKANTELLQAKRELAHSEKDKANYEWRFIQQCSKLDSKLSQHMTMKLGQGSIKMSGTPPKKDRIAQELYQNWMNKKFHLLHDYSSGSFSIKKDTTLTANQQIAENNHKKYVDEIDSLKVEHQKKMEGVQKEIVDLQSRMPTLEQTLAKRQKDLSNCVEDTSHAWDQFKNKCPIEYSHITTMYEVTENIGKVAEWMISVEPSAKEIKGYMDMLKDESEDDPSSLLPVVDDLLKCLQDPDTSCVAFLKGVGEGYLKRFMKPKLGSLGIGDEEGFAGKMKEKLQAIECD